MTTPTADLISRDWQPIETAPKDGTRIDLWMVDQDGAGERIADAYWVTGERASPYGPGRELRDGWYAPNRDYDDAPGWCDCPAWVNQRTGKTHWEQPTHWMPLPEPPRP